jgi:ubiquinone/menaquinone biosynthesis C-methylase UbiE
MPSMNEDAARAAAAMQEETWRVRPEGPATPYAWAWRRDFLLGHVAPGDDVLDLGCGEGAFAAALAEAGARPIGVDVAPAALERAHARHPDLDLRLAAPGEPLPLGDGIVDVVWASEVLAFVPDTARVLSEVRRVLRPDGRLLVTTPNHGRVRALVRGLSADLDPLGPALRFYTRGSLRDVLEAFGFDRVSVRSAGGPPLLRESLVAHARRAPLLTPAAAR